jgi:hypothetical protein
MPYIHYNMYLCVLDKNRFPCADNKINHVSGFHHVFIFRWSTWL